ncbi:energy transducer TonB [Hymenobacter convexus]|uniref:energy transducer TonB n=1 Tax=Hymenobacter sp. CA1UV-4 TaxID=3063782 RepID=UPI0027122754|nr:energy transducer TonB [Hymenobacter sp. CA1UV-4]MDO7850067.1 energy transducer TonB [Hymenobacter sp. CA1UV-4]
MAQQMQFSARLLLIVALALGGALAANAQQKAPIRQPFQRWNTSVEQMPQLPSGGGTRALITAIERQVVCPSEAAKGRVFVSMLVTEEGTIKNLAIVKGLRPDWDAAVLQAVRKITRLAPGRQEGKAVDVYITLPITLQPAPKPPR